LPTYKVRIIGKNFLLATNRGPHKVGFYTERYVQAESTANAEIAAINLLRKDSGLANVVNEKDDQPMMYVDDIEQVSEMLNQPGFAFYPEKLDSE
jgi:hypothetical protein